MIGLNTITMPAIRESAPAAMRNASPSICLRSRIAATISTMPVKIAQKPTSSASTSTVIPGQIRTRTPAMIPNAPSTPYAARWAASPGRKACMMPPMPSKMA